MSELTFATRANAASLLPALLVASSVNQSRPQQEIALVFEDVDILPSDDKATIQFTAAGQSPVYGSENVLKALRSFYPFLKSKDEKLVCVEIFR